MEYIISKIITFLVNKYSNSKNIENNKNIYLKYKTNNKLLSKIKYFFNTTILNIKLKVVGFLFGYYINSGLKKITKVLHPLDAYTIFIDSQNEEGGYQKFKETLGDEKVLHDNLRILFSEHIIIDGKKYPYYYGKYLLELLFLNSYKKVDLLRVNEVPSDLVISIIKRILNLFSIRDKIYFNLLHEYMFTSKSFYRNDLESGKYFINKEVLNNLNLNISKNINDFGINYTYLNLLHILNYKNDIFSENHYINNLLRIKFIGEKLIKYEDHYGDILSLHKEFFDFSTRLFSTQLPHTYLYNINDSKNYQKIIDFLGYYDLEDYYNKVKEKANKYYSGETLLELNRLLFIDSKPIVKFKYPEKPDIVNYSVNYRFLSNIFFYKIREKIGKSEFGNYIENYFNEYFSYQLENNSTDEFKNKYSFGNSKEYLRNYGEIDFYIHNKETKNLILFEIKFKDELNEKIYYKKDILKLTNKGGEIYKGIHQLWKHKEKLSIINEKLDLGGINSVQYVFVNFNKSAMWNMIMRDFLELGSDKFFFWEDFNYTFMSLEEFELFISVCSNQNLDFFDLLERKTNMTAGFPHYAFLANYTPGSTDYTHNIRTHPITGEKVGFIEDDMRQFLYGITEDINKYKTFI